MAMETFKAIGANPIAMELEDINAGVEAGVIVGGESAYPRIYPLQQNEVSTAVIDTQHSLFLTSIIITDSFWNSLDSEIQEIIKIAAIKAGREERKESIRDGDEAIIKLQSEGKEVIKLSVADQTEFKRKTDIVYDKFKNFFSPGLVQNIKIS
jgi:TRAP-type C4-dicarboxylate transport system substrate-binding protein